MLCLAVNAWELPLETASLRGCKGTWKYPEATALKPGRSADIFVAFTPPKDLTAFNRVFIEMTPLEGKFVKRNQILCFFDKKECARYRPEKTVAGEVLENGKKITLEYIISPELKNITALRLFFNRKNGDSSDQKFLLHKIEFAKRFTPRKANQFRYKVDTPTCVLLADSDRGYTPEEAAAGDFGKRVQPRPTAIAKIPETDTVSGKSPVSRQNIPVELVNEAQVKRNARLRFGVPFARGQVFSLENLSLYDERGKAVPAQFAALVRYDDNSLRHLLVTSSAVFAPNEKKIYKLGFGSTIKSAPVNGLKSTLENGVLTVDAGRLKAKVSRRNFNFAENITVDGKPAGKFLPARIVMADGKTFTLADPDSFEIIENGALRLTLRAAGKYTGNAGSYVCRLTFTYNRPELDIEFTHINSVLDLEFTDFKSLMLHFAPADPCRAAGRWFQETDLHYSHNNGPRELGQFSGAFNVSGKFGFALADWYQRYPKALTIGKDSAAIEILPEQPHKKFNHDLPPKLNYLYTGGNYRMKWGMSFSERITLNFDGTPAEVLAAERNLPVIGVLPPAYYRKAGFIPDDTNLAPVDAATTEAFNRYLQRQKQEREYGFFNYGDSFGERGHSWTNNEYDPVHGMLKTYLRTGNRDMLRYGIASARHQADVDTCHAYPNDYFIGANLQHAVGHSGIGRRWSHTYTRYTAASNGHSWVRGRLLVWLLTGDTLVMDSCYMFGDHTAFAVVPNYRTILGKAPRETGWMLRGLSALYTVTGDKEYFKAAQTMARLAVKECGYGKGAWPRVIRRLNAGFGELTKGNNNFQAAIMIKGLCDFYRIHPDKDVKRAIITSARWLAKGFNPGNSAGFNYDIDINGNGLNWPVSQLNTLIAPVMAEAALIGNDPQLFAVAERAFARVLLGRHPVDHKHFAMEWTFMADYLRAAALWNKKHGLKSDYSRAAQKKKLFDNTVPQWRMRGGGKWLITSTAKDARITLCRWVRSGNPKAPVKLVLKDASGKVICTKTAKPGVLRQDIPLQLPGKKGSTFTLEITDSFGGDWSMLTDSRAVYAAAMTPEGIPVAHIGFRRFFIKVPAGKKAVVSYAGSHAGEWSIEISDLGKNYSRFATAEVISLHKLRDDAAVFTLAPAKKERLVAVDCYSSSDARIHVAGCDVISADKRYFKNK